MIAVMGRLMAAKRAHDISALLALYTEDCVLEQPSLGIRSVGHAAMRPSLLRFAAVFPDYQRDFAGAAVDGSRLVSWGEARMTVTGCFGPWRPNGQVARVMTFVLFDFAPDGRIAYEGHHWDLASLCRQSGLPLEAFLPTGAPSP